MEVETWDADRDGRCSRSPGKGGEERGTRVAPAANRGAFRMTAPAVLIYDGTCPICQGGMRWVQRRALPGQFEFVPCDSLERRARFPWMAEQTCLEALQLVLADGRVLPGDAAISEILNRLRGWRWVAAFLRFPGVGLLTPHVYRWVARNRYTISCALGKPAREHPGTLDSTPSSPR